MSFADHFECLLARKTYRRVGDLHRNKTKDSPHGISPVKMNQSTYDQIFVKKFSKSPKKTQYDKFQAFKNDINRRSQERSNKMRMGFKNKDNNQSIQFFEYSEQKPSQSLLCIKAKVHKDLQAQQLQWKKSIKQNIKQSKIKLSKDTESVLSNSPVPSHRLNIKTQSIDKIFVNKDSLIRTTRKLSQTFVLNLRKPDNNNYVVKKSMRRFFRTKSTIVDSSTKCSQKDFLVPQIDAWDCNMDVDQLLL